jgi:hypothetical protein
VKELTAWTVLSEMGGDLSSFSDAKHLASWGRCAPGNNESGGKRRQGRTRKGNRYLRRILVQAAWVAVHSKGTFLSALAATRPKTVTPGKRSPGTISIPHLPLSVAAFCGAKERTGRPKRGS